MCPIFSFLVLGLLPEIVGGSFENPYLSESRGCTGEAPPGSYNKPPSSKVLVLPLTGASRYVRNIRYANSSLPKLSAVSPRSFWCQSLFESGLTIKCTLDIHLDRLIDNILYIYKHSLRYWSLTLHDYLISRPQSILAANPTREIEGRTIQDVR